MMEIFKTPDSESSGGMLMFLGFMPPGAIIGGLKGLFPFLRPAIRDNRRDRTRPGPPARTAAGVKVTRNRPHSCNAKLRIALRASSAI
jgi:hypothetical protein